MKRAKPTKPLELGHPGDRSRAGRNIRWIERHCRIPGGRDVSKPVKFRRWQKDWIVKIYNNPHGTRIATKLRAPNALRRTASNRGGLSVLRLWGPAMSALRGKAENICSH